MAVSLSLLYSDSDTCFRAAAVVWKILSSWDSNVSEKPALTPVVPCTARAIRLLRLLAHENTGRYPTAAANLLMVPLSLRVSTMDLQSMTRTSFRDFSAWSTMSSFFPEPRGPWMTMKVAAVSRCHVWSSSMMSLRWVNKAFSEAVSPCWRRDERISDVCRLNHL